MRNESFFEAPCGQITVATTAILVISAGVEALIGPGIFTLVLMTVSTLLGVVAFIVAVGLATQRFGGHVLAMALALPVLAWAYFAAITVLVQQGSSAGIMLIIAGLLLLATNLAPVVLPRTKRAHA